VNAPLALAAGRRVGLRLLEERDAAALFALYSDQDVMRYWNHAPWTSLDQARAAIGEARADYLTGASLHCAICLPVTGELIGSCALYAISRQHRCASIGYMLAPAHQGQGYLGEAMRLLLAHGFGACNLNRIEAEVNRHNGASCRALERLGFRREGMLRERWIVAGKKHDTIVHALLREDWARACSGCG
jgi:ribosomal-protein-alanine N-acetyltransferase